MSQIQLHTVQHCIHTVIYGPSWLIFIRITLHANVANTVTYSSTLYTYGYLWTLMAYIHSYNPSCKCRKYGYIQFNTVYIWLSMDPHGLYSFV